MKKQLARLYSLLQVVAPDLANYLKKHDSHNMFFCFRWLLVHFKREFSLDEIMTLWEVRLAFFIGRRASSFVETLISVFVSRPQQVIWTNLPCPNFHLLICIAVLDLEKDGLMKDGNGFTEILKVSALGECQFSVVKKNNKKKHRPSNDATDF